MSSADAMTRGVFITGTDTGVGKTVCALQLIKALQASGFSVAGFKPVASGAEWRAGELQNSDARQLQQSASIDLPYSTINPYVYEPAVSPNIAARLDGEPADLRRIESSYHAIARQVDVVVVEGAGGWCTPLADNVFSVDLVRSLNIPVVMVVMLKLGCINHALLTLNALRQQQVDVVGWILNGPIQALDCADEVIQTLQQSMSLPLLARVNNLLQDKAAEPHFDLRVLMDSKPLQAPRQC